MEAAVGVADAISELADRQAIGFADTPFAVDPFGLDGVEPGALGQVAGEDADTGGLLDLAVVVADPGPHLVADVPGGVVPDQEEGRLPVCLELAAAPVEIVDGDGADRPASAKRSQTSSVAASSVGSARTNRP